MPRSPDGIDLFVGASIVALRAEAGLSQAVLAARLGISFQQVQKYEAGTNRVSASRLHRLASLLDVPVESFFPPRPHSGSSGGVDERRSPSMTVGADVCAVASGLTLIEDREVRRALAVLVGALSKAT